jgi:hypothetical protein
MALGSLCSAEGCCWSHILHFQLWTAAHPAKLIVKTPTPNITVLGDGARREITKITGHHEYGAQSDRISVLKRRVTKELPLSPYEVMARRWLLPARKRGSPGTEPAIS